MKRVAFVVGVLLFLIEGHVFPREQRNSSLPFPLAPGRPAKKVEVHNIGELWSMVSNFGNYGDPNQKLPSYDWPGGLGDYYLWEGRFWFGAMVGGIPRVSHADYGNYELSPNEEIIQGSIQTGKGTSMWDIVVEFDDYDPSSNGDPLGVKVVQKALAWSVPTYDDFIAYEYKMINVPGQGPGDLHDFFVCWVFDADVCGADVTDPHIDDLVSYEGWTNNEWTQSVRPEATGAEEKEILPFPYDEITQNPDGTITEEPDGVWDQFTIFGDEPEERILMGDSMVSMGDTFYFWRNMSYIYDSDNPAVPGDDKGEYNTCPGFIGGRILYAPPSSSDSVWVDEFGNPARMIRPYSHQWWNWNNDPGNDEQKYQYMTATHDKSVDENNERARFMPNPFTMGAPVFDYRFMLTTGPYEFGDGDTLEFVFIGALGQGLNGGYDDVYRNSWVPGLRHHMDKALQAYYLGSQHSDPVHPSAPDEDIHWLIPVPPEVPYLQYSGEGIGDTAGFVTLSWDDIAEITPDPVDLRMDFSGYRVYRSKFRVGDWTLIKGFVDSSYADRVDSAAQSPSDSIFSKVVYEWIEGGNFPHSYVDSTVSLGIPYFYAVTAFDRGRVPPEAPTLVASLESGLTNYRKDAKGAEVRLIVDSEVRNTPSGVPLLDKVNVVPNPYIGSASWEGKYENRIHFRNLPGACRIRIYTLSGDFVKEINHQSGTGDAYWNLISRNDQDVVTGVYLYKIEAYDQSGNFVDQKIGKILILR